MAASGDTVRVSLTRVPRSSQDFYDVTGTGTYAAASGHHGVIVVSGTVSRGGALNPGVFLDAQLSYDSLPTDAFYGKVSGDTALIGTLSEAHVEYAAHRALTLVRVPASHAPGIGSATLHN